MTQKIEILNELKKLLKNTFGERIKDVVLFGSQASNSENPDSDYDVLIVTDEVFNWKERSGIRNICFDICVDFEVLIDSKIISQYEIENKFWGQHPLITDALNFGIHAK